MFKTLHLQTDEILDATFYLDLAFTRKCKGISTKMQVPEPRAVILEVYKRNEFHFFYIIIISVHELLRRGNALTLNPASISLMQEHALLKEKEANDVI